MSEASPDRRVVRGADPGPIVGHPRGTRITVWVVPGASRSEVVGRHDDAIKIKVAAPAEGGKANRAVAQLLERTAGCRSAELVGGAGSRRKVFLLDGVEPTSVEVSLGLS